MQKVCQNCKKEFLFKKDELNFYEKIKVPPPTFCPDCRAQRRFIWRVERGLHKRVCDMCANPIISTYDKEVPFPIYCHTCFYSDKWDPATYGIKYDESKNFFSQLKKLLETVPRLNLQIVQSTNSEYTNQSYNNKNIYLSFGIRDSEDSAYCARNVSVKNTFDSSYTHYSENLYECVNVDKSYGSTFTEESEAIIDSHYLVSSRNINNSIGGVNLRSASNYFFGKKLSKEEYDKKIKDLDLGSRSVRQKLEEKFKTLKEMAIFKATKQVNCINCIGDHLENSKDCYFVFDGFGLEKAQHSSWVFDSKDVSDCFGMGGSELIYEAISPEDVNNCKFLMATDSSHDTEYSLYCQASGFLFGCVGLRNKEFYILNTKYEKEEYIKLVEKIKKDMSTNPYIDQRGIRYPYGEFFPSELCHIPYNDSSAQEYYPLNKEEAEKNGFLWRENKIRTYDIDIEADKIPDNIKDVDDQILNKKLGCAHRQQCNHECSQAFKIIEGELRFYKRMNIPPPILCPNCRHFERMKRRNPLKLWKRNCQRCKEEVFSSFSPDRREVIYCESCYQKEVY